MKKLAFLLTIIIFVAIPLGCGTSTAFAETAIYSSVLDDLHTDETFDVATFPAKAVLSKDDKVMDVIQIAESHAGELFLYVYQPLDIKVTATEARISTTIGDNISPQDYKLTLLDRDGTLEKYKVEDLQVKNDVVRYYHIVQLASSSDNDAVPNGNIVNTIAYEVGKLFTACTLDGIVTYTMEYQEYIVIANKRVGYLRYTETSPFLSMLGYGTVGETIDSHYVAFATDKPIDKLYEIDISYSTIVCHKDTVIGVTTETEDSPQTVTATYFADNYVSVDVMNKTYEWKRIQSLNDFVATEPTLTDNTKNELAGMTWVLRFFETNVTTSQPTPMLKYRTHTRVEEVTILRLNFDLDGTTYNLGVVDNKLSETPEQKPDNEAESLLDKLRKILSNMEALWEKVKNFFSKYWWTLLIGLGVVVLIICLAVDVLRKGLWWFIKLIAKGVWIGIKYLSIGVYYVLASPVYLIAWIVKKAKR